MDVDARYEFEYPGFKHDLNLQDGFDRVLFGEVIIRSEEGEEIFLRECFLDVVANSVHRLTQVVVEVDERVDGVYMVEVGLLVILEEKVEAELKLLTVFEPQKLLKAVGVEDVNEESLEVGFDRLSVVIQ